MSAKYDEYIKEHKLQVKAAFEWLKNNTPQVFLDQDQMNKVEHLCTFKHDFSKEKKDEYEAYDAYFYGNNKSFEVIQNFNKAWLLHIHRNPHHWQHWVLITDDSEEPIVLDMPQEYILEMICDWWSFSFSKGNLYEIFDWYKQHTNIKLSENTKDFVEGVLDEIKKHLDTLSEAAKQASQNLLSEA